MNRDLAKQLISRVPAGTGRDAVVNRTPPDSLADPAVLPHLNADQLTRLIDRAPGQVTVAAAHAHDEAFLDALAQTAASPETLKAIAVNPAAPPSTLTWLIRHRSDVPRLVDLCLAALPAGTTLDILRQFPQHRAAASSTAVHRGIVDELMATPPVNWSQLLEPLDTVAVTWAAEAAAGLHEAGRLDRTAAAAVRDLAAHLAGQPADTIPRHTRQYLAPVLAGADADSAAAALHRWPWPEIAETLYRHHPRHADLQATLRLCGDAVTFAGLPAYLTATPLTDDTYRYLLQHAPMSTLRTLRAVNPDEAVLADLVARQHAGQWTAAHATIAAAVVMYGPAAAAVRLLDSDSHLPGVAVHSARADELLHAGGQPAAVLALSSRWSVRDWNCTDRIRQAAVDAGGAAAVAALTLTASEVGSVLDRAGDDMDLLHALANQDAVHDAPDSVRRRLLSRAAPLLQRRNPQWWPLWARTGDLAWLGDHDPAAAQRYTSAGRDRCYLRNGSESSDLVRDIAVTTPLTWSAVVHPSAWDAAADHLQCTLGDDRAAWDTALALLPEWQGSVADLAAAARAV